LDANFANVSASTLTATYVTGNNQSNITDVGTLNSLAVYGNVSAGNVSTNGIVRANAVIGVNYTGTNVSVTGNITGNNIIVNGTLTYANLTFASISVTGNVTGGNLVTAGLITAVGNINGGNVNTGNLTVNYIYSDDSTYVTVNDGLEVVGDLISDSLDVTGNISGYNLVINTIASDDSTAVSVLDDLSVDGDIDVMILDGFNGGGNNKHAPSPLNKMLVAGLRCCSSGKAFSKSQWNGLPVVSIRFKSQIIPKIYRIFRRLSHC
jgi:hypothetical protein